MFGTAQIDESGLIDEVLKKAQAKVGGELGRCIPAIVHHEPEFMKTLIQKDGRIELLNGHLSSDQWWLRIRQ
jgi:hypothetical protein